MTMKRQNFKFIRDTRECFPMQSENYVIAELTNREKLWYCEQLVAPYFNNNIITKMDPEKDKDNAKDFINLYLKYVNTVDTDCYQLRLVIRRISDGSLVGGVTIFYRKNNKVIELGYWVLPEYQGLGIMSEVLTRILITLDEFLDTSFAIHLEIFQNNKVSKILAIKNKFFEISRKSTNNQPDVIVYGLDRKKFKQIVKSR